ncbi:hypothetical protein GGH96_003687 [Coemansia sp. RSA 1972]|nr:hypothetical protein GGH96_003687 [Coemansia sp. RSA 1972]
MKLFGVFGIVLLPIISHALSSAPSNTVQAANELGGLETDFVERNATPTQVAATKTLALSGVQTSANGKAETTPSTTPSTTSSSSYNYSYIVALSGHDGSITHYYVSYSDPYVSGAVGVGHSEPMGTSTPTPALSSDCTLAYPGLLSILGIDLGLRLNLLFLGIDACVAL